MVTQYSRLRLTFSGDRLPALAGLSKQMMHVREGKCLAGVWEDSLFEDLCWQTARGWPSSSPSEGILTPKDAGAYIAPSWSWAPVLVPVEYINDMTNRRRAREFVPDAKLIRVKVVNVDPHDPTGQVVSCLLKLSATWTETYPDKNKRWPPGISKDVYYVLLAIDGSARYWLVLERAGNEHYRRMDLTEGT
ncbi:hypothetical protein C8A05DRAFT_33920 [Staphylotrichum tortipilum]|uniref:Uncharacterized protein n=1 Tax=Staphylotrichum tortipilum TaxID=2831512 RepID=A0AAN6RT26_9PEZI|nr:hypothetical protein C8A05DRAFT_33920 [Staphylotrichum longicolle]